LKALSKTPDARYQSAQEMIEALEALREPVAPRGRARREHDSLAPVEQAVDDAPLMEPKRRAAQLLLAAAALACVIWAVYGDPGQLLAHSPRKLNAANRPAPAASRQLALLLPDESQDTSTDAPELAEPEPPQLVAIQNDAILQPSAAARVTLGAALPHTAAAEQLRSALDLRAITECYRGSLNPEDVRKQPSLGRLDLETSEDGRVRWSRLRAPLLPLSARTCIERAALEARADVRGTNVEASVFARFDSR
jgi:hypothetical protein